MAQRLEPHPLHQGVINETKFEYMAADGSARPERHTFQGYVRSLVVKLIIEFPASTMPIFVGANNIIRDNVCGDGEAAENIMKQTTPHSPLRPIIYSVDSETDVGRLVESRIKQAQCMDKWIFSEPYVFPEDFFSGCITVRQHYYYRNEKDDIRDIFRTLAPAGRAIFSISPFPCYQAGNQPLPQSVGGQDWAKMIRESFRWVEPDAKFMEKHVLEAYPDAQITYATGNIEIDVTVFDGWVEEIMGNNRGLMGQWLPAQVTLFKAALKDFLRSSVVTNSHRGIKKKVTVLICRKL